MAASNARNKAAIASAGGIPPLVSLVRDGSTAGERQYAAGALRNLAGSAANKEIIASAGGIEPLVALLVRPSTHQLPHSPTQLVNFMYF